MTQVVIFGAGKIAQVLHAHLIGDPNLSVVGFTCDRAFMSGNDFCGCPLVPFEEIETSFPPSHFAVLVAIGYQELNTVRAERCEQAKRKGYKLMSWISPRANVATGCTIGANCVVMPGASLQPHASLGEDVFVWDGAVVGHHATVGDHCWLASNCTISSTAVVEPSCTFGVNAAIGHGITIGARGFIGAGAVVTRSAPPNGVYIVRDAERYRLDSERFTKIARLT